MIRTTVGQAFLPAIELVSEGHSCPSRTNSNPLGGARMPRTRGFGQTRMSAPPKSSRPLLFCLPEKLGTPPQLPHLDDCVGFDTMNWSRGEYDWFFPLEQINERYNHPHRSEPDPSDGVCVL